MDREIFMITGCFYRYEVPGPWAWPQIPRPGALPQVPGPGREIQRFDRSEKATGRRFKDIVQDSKIDDQISLGDRLRTAWPLVKRTRPLVNTTRSLAKTRSGKAIRFKAIMPLTCENDPNPLVGRTLPEC